MSIFAGGSTLADLHQALEDYLPVLLGLVKDGSQLQHKVQFVWINQEDEQEVEMDFIIASHYSFLLFSN